MSNKQPIIEVATVAKEESILKFYYCKSEDDYYIGQKVGNFYYAKYDKNCNEFVWCMTRYLPWGEHVVGENTAWKEHTYPSEPIEIGFNEWLKGFIAKYILANGQPVKHGKWVYDYDCSCTKCSLCGAKMDGDEI